MLSDVFLWFMVGFLLIGICVQGRNFVIPHGLVFNINYLGEYEKSIEYLSLSEQEKYSKNDFIMLSEISRLKGQVYYLLGLSKTSFLEFRKAHEYAIRVKDKKERERFTSLAYENLSIAYNIIKGIDF